MGKNNLILGTARGKLGDIVFYRTGGEQRFRTRVRPTNPRTNAQLVQRCIVSTAVKFYSLIAGIANHAFQNYEGSLKNHQRYMKLNIDILRRMALQNIVSWSPITWEKTNIGNYTWKDSSEIAINPYQVSEGDIQPIEYTYKKTPTGATIPGIGMNIPNGIKANEITYNDMIGYLGVNEGDQVTLIALISDKNNGYIDRAYVGRVIMKPNNGDMDTLFFEEHGINDPNKENYGNVKIWTYAGEEETGTIITLANVNNEFTYAQVIGFAVIVSRFENNKWRRSTQFVTIKEGYENNASLQNAVNSYLKSDTSSLYLNQADATMEDRLIYSKEVINEEEVSTEKRKKK